MRKCAQCGSDIPSGNKSCNYCGYNMEQVNKNQGYSFGNMSNMDGGVQNKKVKNIVLIIILLIIFGPFVISILIMLLVGILFMFGVFEEDDYNSCNIDCAGEYIYIGDECYCDDGNIYGDDEIDYSDLNNNIHLYETNTLNLDRYVNNNEDVVVVVCSDFSSGCDEYVVRMMDIAMNNEFNLFVYKHELLDEENQDKLLDYYLGVYNEFNPLTFIISNGRMKSANEENMVRDDLENYLKNNGII